MFTTRSCGMCCIDPGAGLGSGASVVGAPNTSLRQHVAGEGTSWNI
jgi:hypothetical protein